MKKYCTQNNGECESCSLSNYGKDCQNKPLNKSESIALRLDVSTLESIKKLAPEGNVSMWIRLLIKKEIEKKESEA